MTKQYKKYRELFNQYMSSDEKLYDTNISQDEADSFLENIRNEAKELLERVTDDELRKSIEKLIELCNDSSYSHKIYIENKQFIILETKDTGSGLYNGRAAFNPTDLSNVDHTNKNRF